MIGWQLPEAVDDLSTGPSGGADIAAPVNRREWLPDAAVGAVVVFIGLFEAVTTSYYGVNRPAYVLITLGIAAAAALSRRAPGAALGLVWAICAIQLATGSAVLYAEAAVAVVAFGTARWGTKTTVVLSGLSIPASALVGVLGILQGSALLRGFVSSAGYHDLVRAAYQFSGDWKVGAIVIGMALLAAPWLAGLALRFRDRAERSDVSQQRAEQAAVQAHLEYEQANEIARLRAQQARTALDVHDVVGHSLAVILAQAESGQYLPDDTDALKKTMATIATTARTSLQDVRQVLAEAPGPASPRPGGLDGLIDGVRSSGSDIASIEIGSPQPLPPDLEMVAFRVLQEMLTNAIKHGRRDRPVQVERHWPDGMWDDGDLRIEVRNIEDAVEHYETVALPDVVTPLDSGRRGFEGMRRRLSSVGGRIDVRRREEPDGTTFTATAWVPVSGRDVLTTQAR